MKILLFMTKIFCSSSLLSPIFTQQDGKHMCDFSFKKSLNIEYYEIIGCSLDAKETEITFMHKEIPNSDYLEYLTIDLSDLIYFYDIDLTTFCITLVNRNEVLISETFRYDKRIKQFVLARRYNKDFSYVNDKRSSSLNYNNHSSFINYKKYFIGASFFLGIGMVAFLANIQMKSICNNLL